MNVYLVRHAQKDISPKDTTEAHYNRELTVIGVKQAKELGKYLTSFSINYIFSSDMSRAIQTAQTVADVLKIPHIVSNKDLREADPCIIPNYPDRDMIKIQCWQDWDFKPENGESYNEGKYRFHSYFWKQIVERHDDSDNILIVSHGRVIRLFLSEYLKDGINVIKEPYNHVALTHLEIHKNDHKLEVVSYNDNSFLSQDLRI